MDIHAPEGPTNSFKDFAIHIVIVTIGILIALGLEGVRETIHQHALIRDTRENFRAELSLDQNFARLELENTRGMQASLAKIVSDLPELRQHPAQLAARVASIHPSFYFFNSSQWDTALSTGALGLMRVEEINRYSGANFMIHSYSEQEAEAEPLWSGLQAYFSAYPNPTPQELGPGIEKLFLFQRRVSTLVHIGEQLKENVDRALKAR